jgi:hypothetical protein
MTTCACANCQFFDARSKSALKQNPMKDGGLCRFNPPPMAPTPGSGHSQWPVVDKDDWCGHFAATVDRFMPAAA